MRVFRSNKGFSLIETLAALVVFSIVTLGIVPLILGSIRGANLSRSFTVGKNAATEAMERVRSFPYYIDWGTQPKKVDVLDMYFPNMTAYNTTTCAGYFTTTVSCASTGYAVQAGQTPGYLVTCPAAGAPACPTTLPPNYTLTFQSSFVQEEGTGDADTETYNRVAPNAGYRYDLAGVDTPPRLLMEILVTVRWTSAGKARSYDLRTLVGDRQFGDLKVRGSAKVDYAITIVAGYEKSGTTEVSDLVATAGLSESKVETRRVSLADETARALQLRLINADPAIPGCPPTPCPGDDIATPLDGATSTALAPPDVAPANSSVGDLQMDHPQSAYGTLAKADDTTISNVSAATAGGIPIAKGQSESSVGSATQDIVVINKKSDHPDLQLDTDDMVEVIKKPSGTKSIEVDTRSETRALGLGLESLAHAEFGRLLLFKTSFIDQLDGTYDGAVVVIDDFTATAECDATTTGIADAPDVSYSATLRYWRDPTANNLRTDGAYVTVPLSLGGGTDPLAAVMTTNPLVYDTNPSTKDLYLFPKSGHDSYLTSWSSLRTGSTTTADQGRAVTAALGGAISIETAGVEKNSGSLDPDTSIGVSIGSLSCSAEDRR